MEPLTALIVIPIPGLVLCAQQVEIEKDFGEIRPHSQK